MEAEGASLRIRAPRNDLVRVLGSRANLVLFFTYITGLWKNKVM